MSQAEEQRSALVSKHLFSDRHGGVSDGCYTSLNVAYAIGDSPDHVRDNREIIRQQAGVAMLLGAHQVHGNRVEIIAGEVHSDWDTEGVDALITDREGIGLMGPAGGLPGNSRPRPSPLSRCRHTLRLAWKRCRGHQQYRRTDARCFRLSP